MSRFLLIVSAFFAAAILASCATLTKADCTAGDWRSIGIGDGNRGLPASHVDNHISACAEYGITLDRALYESGRQEGLRVYCRLERAETDGRRGRTNYNSCQGELGVAFNRVHAAATAIHDLDKRISTLDGRISTAIAELAKPELDDAAREALRREIRTMQNERLGLERQRSSREQDLARVRRNEEMRLMQAGIAY